MRCKVKGEDRRREGGKEGKERGRRGGGCLFTLL